MVTDHTDDRLGKLLAHIAVEKNRSMRLVLANETKQAIRQLIREEQADVQVSDRKVTLGWMEANKDNLSVEEIIATIQGQLAALRRNPPDKVQ